MSLTLLPPSDFVRLAGTWCKDQSAVLLGFVWAAYDQMRKDNPPAEGRSLERNITQLLEPRIHRVMSGDEPFYVQHGPYEYETMKAPPAQPPQYDIAFVFTADERIMWPLEAKVLDAPDDVSEYGKDVRDEFLKCRYAPFSSEGAMLGYLLTGTPADAFQSISKEIPCVLNDHPTFPLRSQKQSHHVRTIPTGKVYSVEFTCHHLILEYSNLTRIGNSHTSSP